MMIVIDDIGEGIEEGEDPIKYWPDHHNLTCPHCNTSGLRWKKYASGYTFINEQGRIHHCVTEILNRFSDDEH